jgi:hypothetical protein
MLKFRSAAQCGPVQLSPDVVRDDPRLTPIGVIAFGTGGEANLRVELLFSGA